MNRIPFIKDYMIQLIKLNKGIEYKIAHEIAVQRYDALMGEQIVYYIDPYYDSNDFKG